MNDEELIEKRSKALRKIIPPDDIYLLTQVFIDFSKLLLVYAQDIPQFEKDLEKMPLARRLTIFIADMYYQQNKILNIEDKELEAIFENENHS